MLREGRDRHKTNTRTSDARSSAHQASAHEKRCRTTSSDNIVERRDRYKARMQVTPIARLCVPAGTAAAAVIALTANADAAIEARRFARLAQLDDVRFRAEFEELMVNGVYVMLAQRVLVLRISHGGVRTHAAIVCLRGGSGVAPARAGLAATPSIEAIPDNGDEECAGAQLRRLLESETKQRPIFHAITAEGTTYSAFDGAHAAAILEVLAQGLAQSTPSSALAAVFVGEPQPIPTGLFVAVAPAVD